MARAGRREAEEPVAARRRSRRVGRSAGELVQPQEDLDTTIAKNIEYLLE